MRSSGLTRLVAALCLCLAGAMVSGLLLLQHHGESRAVATVDEVCGEGGGNDCDTVARSAWSTVGGVPIAGLGLLFYASLSLLLALTLLLPETMRGKLAGLAILGLVLGLLVDLLLLGVQAFSIRAFCTLCIVTYVLSAAALFALLPDWRGALDLGSVARTVEGRLALGGWVLGTLAIAGAVLAVEIALDTREAQRQVALLGAPAPAPLATPAPESPATPSDASAEDESDPAANAPSDGKDAAYWEKRASELQQTLDDPQKLEQYFTEKARREFETAAPVTIDLEGVPRKGPADAAVQVVEFSDFLCPFCRNLAGALNQFVPQAEGRVAVYFKNFPLDQECNPSLPRSSHPGACKLALGAICAEYQGKFEPYHDRVFSAEGLRNPGTEDVVRLAGEAGLNPAAMRGCLEDPKASADLAAQIEEAKRLEIQATPTLYVNGKKLPRINDFVAVVDREAQKKGFAPLSQ